MISWNLKQATGETLKSQLDLTRDELTASGETTLSRPLNRNTIVLDWENGSGQELQERAELFARYQPGRIFYFSSARQLDLPGGVQLTADAPLACGSATMQLDAGRQLKSDRALLSEFVFCSLDSFSAEALASIVHAHLHVGFRPHLVLLGEPSEDQLAETFLVDSDAVFFSSLALQQRPRLLKGLLRFSGELVDFEWLQLTKWRAQLRNMSIQHDLSEQKGSLERILLSGNFIGDEPHVPDPRLCLYAGWLLDQLNSRASALGREGFECVSADQPSWTLRLEEAENSSKYPISAVHLVFKGGRADCAETRVNILLNDSEKFENSCTKDLEQFSSSAAFGASTRFEDLVRYFTSGESTLRYRESFERGQELCALAAGGARL